MNINMLLRKNSLRTSEYEMKLRKETLILCEILIIAAFIYTYIVYGISRPDKGEVCIYDNILYSEYYGFEMILLIFLSVIIQADLRSSHRCAVIIRYKSIRHYWNNICKNITAKCMEMTSILLINIIGLCIILKIFNVSSLSFSSDVVVSFSSKGLDIVPRFTFSCSFNVFSIPIASPFSIP